MAIPRHHIICDFLDYIQNVRRYSIHTIRSYTYDLDDFTSFCIHNYSFQEFVELKQNAIQAYLQHLSMKGLTAKTLARRLASIKSFYKYMLKNKTTNIAIKMTLILLCNINIIKYSY